MYIGSKTGIRPNALILYRAWILRNDGEASLETWILLQKRMPALPLQKQGSGVAADTTKVIR